MAIKDAFIGELKHESSMTKKILEKVPLDRKDWKPHEKSMSLGRFNTCGREYALGFKYHSY